jgi:hypothetical protein
VDNPPVKVLVVASPQQTPWLQEGPKSKRWPTKLPALYRVAFWAAGITAILGAIAPQACEYLFSLNKVFTDNKELLAYAGTVSAIVTFLATSGLTARIALKRYTSESAQMVSTNNSLQEQHAKFNKVFGNSPTYTPIPASDLELAGFAGEAAAAKAMAISASTREEFERKLAELQARKDAVEACRVLLNFYEGLAIGIHSGEHHEGLIKKHLAGLIVKHVQIAWPLMQAIWKQQADAGMPKFAYAELVWLVRRWD